MVGCPVYSPPNPAVCAHLLTAPLSDSDKLSYPVNHPQSLGFPTYDISLSNLLLLSALHMELDATQGHKVTLLVHRHPGASFA